MLKTHKRSVIKPFSFLFGNCISHGFFPNNWEKASIIPAHKKENEQLVSNYRLVSLSPVCSKIFENLIFDSIFDFLDRSCLLTKTNRISCLMSNIHQLIAITNNIFTAFDTTTS